MALTHQHAPAAPAQTAPAPAQAPATDFGSNSMMAMSMGSTQAARAPAAAAKSTPAWAAPVAPSPLLKRGSKGAAVTDLQNKLKSVGHSPGAIDGDFGPATEAAVRSFQKSKGLAADGIAGPNTMGALNAAISAKNAAGTILKLGSKGPAVTDLQTKLKAAGHSPGTIDGDFGPKTDAAVRGFQKGHGLTADGLAGPLTMAALAKAAAPKPAPAAPAPAPAPAAGGALTGVPELKLGSKGPQVTTLQSLLNASGISCAVDGDFGPKTDGAVRSYQASRGLAADGIVGPKTAASLNSKAPAVKPVVPVTVAPAAGASSYDPKGYLNSSSIAPATRSAAQSTAAKLQAEGHQPYIVAGFRSTAEQDALYAQGRTKSGPVVTGVKGGGSWHNYGAAVDFAFWNASHTGPSWEEKYPWSRIGPLGLSSGFTRWGGDFGDRPHLELHPKWGNSCYNLASTLANEGLQSVWGKIGAS